MALGWWIGKNERRIGSQNGGNNIYPNVRDRIPYAVRDMSSVCEDFEVEK